MLAHHSHYSERSERSLYSKLKMKNITTTVFVIPMLILFGSVRAFIEPSSFSINSHKTENMMDLPLRAHGDDENQDSDFKKWKKTRMARLDGNDDKFVTGEELRNLRLDLESLRQNIQWAEAFKDETRIESLAKAIKEGESRDPVRESHRIKKTVGKTNVPRNKLSHSIPSHLNFAGFHVSKSAKDPGTGPKNEGPVKGREKYFD